jgi:hypothetical protein
MSTTARHARMLDATTPEAFAIVLPEIERCQRLSDAWDREWERLSADHAEHRAKLEQSL